MSDRIRIVVLALVCTACGPRVAQEVVRYPSGHIQSQTTRVDGKRHGMTTSFYESGQVAWRGTFEHGFKHGLFEYFDPMGHRTAKKIYDRGAPVWESENPTDEPPAHLATLAPSRIAEPSDGSGALAGLHATKLSTPRRWTYFGSELAVHRIKTADRIVRGAELDVFGEYALGRWGVTGEMSSRFVGDDDTIGVGGGADKAVFAFGGVYELATPLAPIALRGRFFVPWGTDSEERFAQTSLLSYGRPESAALAYPQAAGLRLDCGFASRWSHLFYGARLGFDAVFDYSNTGDEVEMLHEAELLARMALRAGVVESDYFGGLELASVGVLTDNTGERAASVVSGLLVVDVGRVRPSARVTLPLDRVVRGNSVSLTFGLVIGEGGWR